MFSFGRIHDLIPISKRLLLIIWPFLAVVLLLAFLGSVSLEILSAARAYVGGESLWSKAQKDAAYHLRQYAETHSEADYQNFLKAIAVPLGDRKARLELEKTDPIYDVARQGFLEGGNHPQDIPGLIKLFRYFRNVSYIDRAIAVWTEGDGYIIELSGTADRLHRQITGRAGAKSLHPLLKKIDFINSRLTPLEQTFSYTLGEAARKTQFILLVGLLITTTGLILVGILLTRRMLLYSETVEHALRTSEEKYRLLWETTTDAVVLLDEENRIQFVNPAITETFGYPPEEVLGKSIAMLQPARLQDAHRTGVKRYLETGVKKLNWRSTEAIGLHRNGLEFPVEIAFSHVSLEGKPLFAGFIRDITERKRVEKERRAAEERLNSILSSIDNVIWSISATTYELLYLNPAAEKLYGLPVEDFYKDKKLWLEVVHPGDRKRVEGMLSDLLAKTALTIEYRILRPNGEVRWLEDRAHVVLDTDGRPIRYDGVVNDVTERKTHEREIEYLATHDSLTGLPNRNLLADRIGYEIARVRRAGGLFAVLFLDLDNFKFVNDSYGHPLGDALLRVVAGSLLSLVRESDTVARLGGDEFLVLLSDLKDPEDTGRIALKVLDLFTRPIAVAGHELHLTGSIGIALYPGDGRNLDELLMHADTAMYRAKELGRNSVEFYTQEMGSRSRERVALEASLRQALELQQFELYYQPQLNIRSGKILGAEALIRWKHPELGMVSSAKFIPLAEETGLIVPIGEWVLRTACTQNKAWQHVGLPTFSVAVNLSARQFRQAGLAQWVAGVLAQTGLEARYLELELTESMVMHNPEKVVAILEELKAMGVQLSIDDFGTGYSSLNYLKRFPVHRLKVDQSFVRDISTDPDDAAIVQAVITLGHTLGLEVIAEGVETEAQLVFLREQGCDAVQGYFFSRPVSVADFTAVLEAGKQSRPAALR